jgi:hypothetical protein
VPHQHRLQYYLDGRLFEWAFSTCCLLLGVGMFIWPRIAQGSIVRVLVDVVGWPVIAVIFTLVGFASMLALVVNGNSFAIGPRVRACCAIWRSVLWAQFTLSMIHVSVVQGFPSPMMFFFSVFTLSEFYVIYRAVLDVRDH